MRKRLDVKNTKQEHLTQFCVKVCVLVVAILGIGEQPDGAGAQRGGRRNIRAKEGRESVKRNGNCQCLCFWCLSVFLAAFVFVFLL